MDEPLPDTITWRGIVLTRREPWLWISDDRLWIVTTFRFADYYVARSQADLAGNQFLTSGPTAELALDGLALMMADFAQRLAKALAQIEG